RYELDLSKPYDYMVARMLLSLANKSEGLEFTAVEHSMGERGAWKPVVLARRTLSTAVPQQLKGPGDGHAKHGSPQKFGERVLGTGVVSGSGGDWRVPAEALLSYCGVGGERSGRESEPQEVASFFVELGLEPTPMISEKVCEAFNAARRAERDHEQGTSTRIPAGLAGMSQDNGGGFPEEHAPTQADGEASHNAAVDDRKEVGKATQVSPVGRTSTSGRPSRAKRERPVSPTSARASRSFPGSPISSPRGSSGSPSGDGTEDHIKTPFDVAKHVFDLLFLQADEDRSGCIDSAEFGEMLRQLGRNISPNVVRHCLASYDIDRSNTIEAAEFVDFMTHEFLAPALPAPGVLCEATGNSAWEVPKEGRLRMTVVADYVAPAPVEVASQEAVDALISNIKYSAKTEQDRLEMFQLATEARKMIGTDFYMTSLNAQALIDEWNNGMNLVEILEILLPQMSSDRNVVSLIENNLSYAQKLELRNKLGQAWGPLVGNPTGTYCLDMSDSKHLIAARRLAMINHAEKSQGMSGAAGRHDTSQRGHWNNFRNETFNGIPFVGRGVEGRWFVTNPPKGKVRLDYVSTTRPFPGSKPLSDRRFRQLLRHLDLGDMRRSSEHPGLFKATPDRASVASAAAAAVAAAAIIASSSPSVKSSAASKAASIVAPTGTATGAPGQPKRSKPKKTRGTLTTT
ncbi:unnamed protein product, partial [Hapterophycus canaliculatus]